MSSERPDVSRVPKTSGKAPYCPRDGTQLFEKTKFMTPVCSNAGSDSMMSFKKKNPMITSTLAAMTASTPCRNGSAKRGPDARGRDPRAGVVTAAMSRSACDRCAVAHQAVDLGLGRRLDRVRQRRVLQLRCHSLAVAEGVVQPVLQQAGLRLVEARLARILVDEQERHRCDRVRVRARRVDRAEAQIRGRLGGCAGGRGRGERRR